MKTYNYIISLSVAFALFISIQTTWAQKQAQKARQMMSEYDYSQAINVYNDYLKTNPAEIDNARDLALCYMKVNDTKSSEEWLSKVVSYYNYTSADVLIYANILKSEGKYQDAILQYQKFASLEPAQQNNAEKWISSCKSAVDWIANPVFFDVANAPEFNTENSDFGLIPFEGGFLLTSDRRIKGITYSIDEIYGWTGNPYLKLYYSDNGKDIIFSPVKDLNNNYHNGPGVYDNKDKVLYFTRTKMVKIVKKPVNSDPTSWYDHSTSGDYTNRLEIFSAKYSEGKWQEPQAFGYNNPEEYSVGHPALAPDGNTLYFSSDMPGGYGNTDIYFCEKQEDGSWSQPKNAGSVINTDGKEVFPYVDKDGTMYFSSDGQAGMGGLDIFSATGSKDNWTIPVNLQYPFNSSKDDFSIIFTESGQNGYLSSNRYGGKGDDDIYSFSYAPPTSLTIAVTALERLEDGSLVKLPEVSYEAIQGSDIETTQKVFSENGLYISTADCNSKYLINGTKDGYFASAVNIETPICKSRADTVFAEMIFDKIIVNKPIVLENIYYDFDKWNIRPDAAIELEKLVTILKNNPKISVELGSHTDCRGTFDYNENLSQKRAESAVAYIISRGIDATRITAKGYGEYVPVNNCVDGVNCTDEQYQMNRRTEFKVTRISE
jgi:outer membrane protein OmpA-like peptidoglycan-associated protein/tetratricopeptide (TPR) repeat protein